MKFTPRPYGSLVFRYRKAPPSGNAVNGLGEAEKRPARLVFHWSPGRKPHPWMALDLHFTMVSGMGGPILGWGSFIERLRNMWQLRRAIGPVAPTRRAVADLLEMPVNTVKSHLQRSLALLRDKLAHCRGEVAV